MGDGMMTTMCQCHVVGVSIVGVVVPVVTSSCMEGK